MPESTYTDADRERAVRIETKLNILARAIGGAELKKRWEAAEADLSRYARTFRRRRCGCFVGSEHEPGCEEEARRRVAAGAGGGERE